MHIDALEGFTVITGTGLIFTVLLAEVIPHEPPAVVKVKVTEPVAVADEV